MVRTGVNPALDQKPPPLSAVLAAEYLSLWGLEEASAHSGTRFLECSPLYFQQILCEVFILGSIDRKAEVVSAGLSLEAQENRLRNETLSWHFWTVARKLHSAVQSIVQRYGLLYLPVRNTPQ